MIKLVFALRRLPSMSRKEFQAYWRNQHAPLVASTADAIRVRRYVQAHTLQTPLDGPLREGRGSAVEPFDGVAELWWDSLEDLAEALASPEGAAAGAALLEDERRFIDLENSPIWLAQENEVVAAPS